MRRSLWVGVVAVASFAVLGVAACVGDSPTGADTGGDSGADGSTSDGSTTLDGSMSTSDAGVLGDAADSAPQGTYLRDILGPDGLGGQSAMFDSAGNIIVALTVNGSVQIAGKTFATPDGGTQEMVVYKLDPTGQNMLWSLPVSCSGGSSGVGISAMSTDKAGNVYIAGYYGGTSISFGTGSVTNPGASIAPYALQVLANGTPGWISSFGAVAGTSIYFESLNARAKSGTELLVSGGFNGTFAVPRNGGGTYKGNASTGYQFGFVWDLDTATGNLLWGRVLASGDGSNGPSNVHSARGVDDAVLVSGYFSSTTLVDDAQDAGAGVGITPITASAAGNEDFFVLRIDNTNPHKTTFQKNYGDPTGGVLQASTIVPTGMPDGKIALCASYHGKVNPGMGEVTSKDTNSANHDALVFMVDPSDGSTKWQTSYGGLFDDQCSTAAADADGNLVVFGQHSSSGIMLGTATLGDPPPAMSSIHQTATHMAKLDGKTGKTLWAYTDTNAVMGARFRWASLDIGPSGQSLFTGNFTGDCDFGGGDRTAGQALGNIYSTFIVERGP